MDEHLIHYPGGALKARYFSKKGKLHGPSLFYGPEGTLLVRSAFEEGQQVGEAEYFYLSGQREKIERYREGVKHGMQEAWYEDGTLRSRMPFCSGSLHGLAELFWHTGQPKRACGYAQHAKEGWDRIWDVKGRPVYEGEYAANLPIGVHRYFVDDLLRREWHYREVGHCVERTWDSRGVLIREEVHPR